MMSYEQQMMTEALAEHEDCCTEAKPCMLRVGVSRVLAKKALRPDVRASENAPLRPSGRGTGRAARTVRPTEAQSRFWISMLEEVKKLDSSPDAGISFQELWDEVKEFRQYSELIGRLKTSLALLRRTTPAKYMETLSEGMYETDGSIYKVKPSKAGHLYAMRLTENGTFEYAPGVARNIRPEHRMSLETARGYGRRTGRCCCCGRTLTNPDSIEAGIGPICAERL